jgi:hypothetical protein
VLVAQVEARYTAELSRSGAVAPAEAVDEPDSIRTLRD